MGSVEWKDMYDCDVTVYQQSDSQEFNHVNIYHLRVLELLPNSLYIHMWPVKSR